MRPPERQQPALDGVLRMFDPFQVAQALGDNGTDGCDRVLDAVVQLLEDHLLQLVGRFALLGVKAGRTSGLRLGYSQVANPLYLVKKRSVSLRWALKLMGGNIASNIVGAVNPPPYIDRRGRLQGNLLAVGHLLSGSLDPKYINRM